MKSDSNDAIIFFDGVCGLCNGFVDFILQIDSKKIFKFSPLQSEYAQKNLPQEYTQSLDSVVVVIDGKILKKGEAVMAVFNRLGGAWKILALTGMLPKSLMDSGYDLVASNRYKLFGKKETCRIPTPEERARFIL
jgi:predicted DCC family thiol-disulfide oxidoreductase YuxK